MAQRITYLLGAGASAQAIPVVDEMPDKINEVVNLLDLENNYRKNEGLEQDINDFPRKEFLKRDAPLFPKLNDIIEDLKWLHGLSIDHSSIDTAAKKFYIIEDKENLFRLKKALSIFFLLIQRFNQPDKRYDKFWASVLVPVTNEKIVPKNVSIVTWNYDDQLQLSFNNFITKIGHAKQTNFLPESLFKITNEDFFMAHLNGVAGLYKNKEKDEYFMEHRVIRKKHDPAFSFLAKLLLEFDDSLNDPNNIMNLNFAWELHKKELIINASGNYLNKVCELIAPTEILVIIGYSFPYFNREIDDKLIRSLKNLKKVYIQVKDEDFESIKFKIENYFNLKVKNYNVFDEADLETKEVFEQVLFQVKGRNEFFIPPEF